MGGSQARAALFPLPVVERGVLATDEADALAMALYHSQRSRFDRMAS